MTLKLTLGHLTRTASGHLARCVPCDECCQCSFPDYIVISENADPALSAPCVEMYGTYYFTPVAGEPCQYEASGINGGGGSGGGLNWTETRVDILLTMGTATDVILIEITFSVVLQPVIPNPPVTRTAILYYSRADCILIGTTGIDSLWPATNYDIFGHPNALCNSFSSSLPGAGWPLVDIKLDN